MCERMSDFGIAGEAAARRDLGRKARIPRPASLAADTMPTNYASMIRDREIWACANTLLQQHGDNAWFVASTRADELLAEGDLEGQRSYVRIVDRITQLEKLEPADAVH